MKLPTSSQLEYAVLLLIEAVRSNPSHRPATLWYARKWRDATSPAFGKSFMKLPLFRRVVARAELHGLRIERGVFVINSLPASA